MTEAFGMEVAGGMEKASVDSSGFEASPEFPANAAVADGFISEEIFSVRDWQESTNDSKQQLSSFSFMGIGFQLL